MEIEFRRRGWSYFVRPGQCLAIISIIPQFDLLASAGKPSDVSNPLFSVSQVPCGKFEMTAELGGQLFVENLPGNLVQVDRARIDTVHQGVDSRVDVVLMQLGQDAADFRFRIVSTS